MTLKHVFGAYCRWVASRRGRLTGLIATSCLALSAAMVVSMATRHYVLSYERFRVDSRHAAELARRERLTRDAERRLLLELLLRFERTLPKPFETH